MKAADVYLTRAQCAKWLGVSVRTLVRDAAKPAWKRQIPVCKWGRVVRYHKATILAAGLGKTPSLGLQEAA